MNPGNKPPNKLEHSENASLEKGEAPPHTTIEYYKHKSNGIERHLDDVLQAALFNLATKDRSDYERSVKNLETHRKENGPDKQPDYDALSIKYDLQRSYLPTLSGTSFEKFLVEVRSYSGIDISKSIWNSYLDRLSPEDEQKYLVKRKRTREEAINHLQQIRSLKIDGLEIRDNAAHGAIFTKNYVSGESRGYRINIKTSPLDDPYVIIHDLVNNISTNKDAMRAGFGIKTFGATGAIRDGVIIYVKDGAFSDIAKVVTKYFDDNPQYHDRHADQGIMFGVPLESADRRKFPGIRVTSDPREPFMTFNYLQAGIISSAVVEYIKKYYYGDHTEMLRQFRNDYYDAYLLWEQNFPPLYKQAVREIVGGDQQTDNIAFLAEDSQK